MNIRLGNEYDSEMQLFPKTVPLKSRDFLCTTDMQGELYPMGKTRFTESQIVSVLKEIEGGRAATDTCREYGIGSATCYKWTSPKFSDLKNSKLFIDGSARTSRKILLWNYA